MNFAKVFQIDPVHQLLIEVVDVPLFPPDTCLRFSTVIHGARCENVIAYPDEDITYKMYDDADEEYARGKYMELRDEYYTSM